MSHLSLSALQAVKYGCVGLANTAVTAVVIFLCLHTGMGVYSSNATGYVVGILFSFLINSMFTFATKLSFRRFLLFIMVCGFCYCVNLIAMKSFFHWYPEKYYFGQLVGMFFYTVTGFVLNKFWVMR